MIILAYIFAISSIIIAIFFFKIWESGKYYKVAILSIIIRILLIPIFEIFGDRVVPAELPELLQWYAEWQTYTDIEGFKDILLNPFGIAGPRGMYLYYTMYAGWFLDWTKASDMIPLRLFTAALSLYIIVFANQIVKWIYDISLTAKQIFIITNWPFWLYYSTMLGRTMPSVIIPLVGILITYKLLQNFSAIGLLLLFITFWLTLILRTFYSLFFFTTFMSFFIYNIFLRFNGKEKILKKYLLGFLALFLLILLSKTFDIQDAFSLVSDNLTESDQVTGESSGSSYLTNFYPQKYADLFSYMPIQGVYFMFSPMIWDVHKAEQLVSSIFSILLLWTIVKVFLKQDSYYKKSENAKMLMLNMVLISMLLGAGVKNAGAAQRWRLPVTSIILCVVMTDFFTKSKDIIDI